MIEQRRKQNLTVKSHTGLLTTILKGQQVDEARLSEFRAVVAQKARRKVQEVQSVRVAEESAAEVEQEPSPFQSANDIARLLFKATPTELELFGRVRDRLPVERLRELVPVMALPAERLALLQAWVTEVQAAELEPLPGAADEEMG